MELELIKLAYQLATIATDWDLTEIEIDSERISIYDIRDRFRRYIDNH